MAPSEARPWKVWVEKSGKDWRCRWIDHAGGAGQATFIYKSDADEAKDARKRAFQRIDADLPPLPKVADTRLLELTEKRLKYCRRELETSTVNKFDAPAMTQLVEFFGDIPISTITPDDLEEWLDWLREEREYSETTVAMRYAHAAPLFADAKARGFITVNPFEIVPKPKGLKGARLLTNDEIRIMLGILPPAYAKPMVLDLCSGMRKEELRILDWKRHVDVSRPIWEISLQGSETKNGKPKLVPVSKAVQEIIGPPGDGPVFPEFTNSGVQYWLNGKNGDGGPVSKKIGRVRWHDLKHYFCTNYLRDTGDIYGCSAITGNSIRSLESNYKHWLKPRTDRIAAVHFGFLPPLQGP